MDVPTRKRSSTETHLVDESIRPEHPLKPKKKPQRRRSSWQFVELTGSSDRRNSANLQELYFQFPKGHAEWLYRVDGPYKATGKLVRQSSGNNDEPQVVHSYESGEWTQWLPFSPSDSEKMERAAALDKEEISVVNGLYDVLFSKRSMVPIYWEGGTAVPIRRATWWSKIPPNIGIDALALGAMDYAPLSEEEALEAESAMLLLYSSSDEQFLASRIISREKNVKKYSQNPGEDAVDVAFAPLLSGKLEILDSVRKIHFVPDAIPNILENTEEGEVPRPPVPWPMGISEAIASLEKALEAGYTNSVGLLGGLLRQRASIRRGRPCPSSISGGSDGEHAHEATAPPKNIAFVVHGIGEAFAQVHAGEFFGTVIEAAGELNSSVAMGDVVYLPISWASVIHEGNSSMSNKIKAITLPNTPMLRNVGNDVISDILFYGNEVHKQNILRTVTEQINEVYETFLVRNPGFSGECSIVAHSLGTVVVFDLLQLQRGESEISEERLALNMPIQNVFNLGSPLGLFLAIRNMEGFNRKFRLPNVKRFFNIFHEFDPVAYRLEPLFDTVFSELEPVEIERADKSVPAHAKLKTTAKAVYESFSLFYEKAAGLKDMIVPRTNLGSTESGNELSSSETTPLASSVAEGFGNINGGNRVDYQLVSSDSEVMNPYLTSAKAHFVYWSSKDFVEFMKEQLFFLKSGD